MKELTAEIEATEHAAHPSACSGAVRRRRHRHGNRASVEPSRRAIHCSPTEGRGANYPMFRSYEPGRSGCVTLMATCTLALRAVAPGRTSRHLRSGQAGMTMRTRS